MGTLTSSSARVGVIVTTLLTGSGPDRGSGRHRQVKRPRLSLLLLDPPNETGLPPGTISGIPLPRPRGRRLPAIAALAALALTAFAGVAIALPSTHRATQAPIATLLAPFPSVVAGGLSPGSTAGAHGGKTGQNAMPTPSMMPVSTAPVTPSPVTTTASASAMASPGPTATQPTVTVTFLVVSQWHDGFLGEVTVVNAGSSPISGWQIAVALPWDEFTAVSDNASGYMSHHILLLQPAGYADSVPANGTLAVFFIVYGTQETPELCAFNNTACGLTR